MSLFSYVRMFASNRQKSEDAAEVFERGEALIVVLADGAGGIRGGATASGALVASVRTAVDDPSFAVEDVQYWADLFRVTDAALAKNRVGETTAVVVVVGLRQLIGVSTGDSEAWVVTATEVHDLTRGQHTKQRLGSGRVEPVVFKHAALSGALVVASDGLDSLRMARLAVELEARLGRTVLINDWLSLAPECDASSRPWTGALWSPHRSLRGAPAPRGRGGALRSLN